jgi:hypothetical protein
MIFWLGEKEPIRARRPAPAPLLQLANNCNSEFLALNDPTLFALPHREGFSGMAWLDSPPLTNASFYWTEEPRWLSVSVTDLGATFKRLVTTNLTVWLEAAATPEPNLFLPQVDMHSRLETRSSLRIEGVLAQWRALRPFQLPSWPARPVSATDTDLLTNTVVQLVVDGQGQPRSATLLTSSGSPDADNFALDQARMSRFEPPGGLEPNAAMRASPLSQLCWGRLIFEWHTLPVTNSPTGNPAK